MARFKLSSGVILETSNESIAQQYRKYGAVELLDEVKEEKVAKEDPDTKQPKKTKKS